MTAILALAAKLLRGTAGTQGATEVKNIKDLSLALESSEADVTTRATGGWKASLATLKEASLEFGMVYDPADADFVAFRTAYFSNTPISLFVTDGSGNGFDADFTITKFTNDQNLEEAISVSVSAKPTLSSRAPQWVTASSGNSGGGGGG